MEKSSRIKAMIAFALILTVCIVAITLDVSDSSKTFYPTDDTKIMLYGEMHGVKAYYDVELQLWQGYYDDGCRALFVELPYYSAEFLNIWLKEASDELLVVWFEEIDGTLSGNKYYYDLLCNIKNNCPETVFYGTDVGHQWDTTGVRYLKYLEGHGLRASDNYKLAEECIRQGKEYYESDGQHSGASEMREAYMVSNFEAAYERCGGGRIMGIYGSYHTNLSANALMAGRLKANLGDIISSVKIGDVMVASKDPYQLGICFSGLLVVAMLLVPNVIWACGKKPTGCEAAEKRESKVLLAFERIGEVVAVASLLIFPSVDPLIAKLPDGVYFRWNLLIWIAAFVLMILYECYWIKYFKSSLTLKDMYSSFVGFPVAGSTLPVTALLLFGVYSRNLILVVAAVILGVGHVGIHLSHKREADAAEKNASAV